MIAIYMRVSTTEQAASDKTSLASQERVCRGAAMIRGVDDVMLYCDPGVSGSVPLEKRPAGGRMLREIQSGDVVIAAKLDRMFRSCSDALTTIEALRDRGISTILTDMGADPVNENGAAKFFFTIMAGAAEFENNRRSERMVEGRKGKLQRGGHIGGEPPFGFIVEGSGRDAKLLPDPKEQEVVKLVVGLTKVQMQSMRRVCAELGRRNICNRAGGEFKPNQIKRILDRANHAV